MSIPGFTADLSLFPLKERRTQSLTIISELNSSQEILPQLSPCLENCQNSWSNCVQKCEWWEWVIGSCIPKCRVDWIACVGRCTS